MPQEKKCVLILPYFGTFNNYFQLFLDSFGKNEKFDLLLFTDSCCEYIYPNNVKVIKYSLEQVKSLAEHKIGMTLCLSKAYKLCDYKPAYGLIFEDYIEEYPYWGHCDCDLLFGNLDDLLVPLLDKDYDKLFAAGHLTIYRNSSNNNRRFMKSYNDRTLYVDAFSTDEIFVFDEDYKEKNVHRIFLNDFTARVFEKDMSMNVKSSSATFVRARYDDSIHEFVYEDMPLTRYFWNGKDIISVSYNSLNKNVKMQKYIYIHLQSRKMRVNEHRKGSYLEILPDRFVHVNRIPSNKKEMRLWNISFSYFFWLDFYSKRIKRKLIKLFTK